MAKIGEVDPRVIQKAVYGYIDQLKATGQPEALREAKEIEASYKRDPQAIYQRLIGSAERDLSTAYRARFFRTGVRPAAVGVDTEYPSVAAFFNGVRALTEGEFQIASGEGRGALAIEAEKSLRRDIG